MEKQYKIFYYKDKNGTLPFREWRKSVDPDVTARIDARIERMKYGSFGDSKHLQEGVHELRLHCGSGYRIYFGQMQDRIVILLCGGDISSQSKDIIKAFSFWKDYKVSKTWLDL